MSELSEFNTKGQLQFQVADQKIGAGGQADVYLAQYNSGLGQPVTPDNAFALKVFKPEAEGGRDIFNSELDAIKTFGSHPNIIQVIESSIGSFTVRVSLNDVSKLGDLFKKGGERPYILMELAEGGSVKNQQPMPLVQVVRMADHVASALDHIHSHGIVHRDIKPGNILVTGPEDSPIYKVADFGAATRAFHPGDPGSRQKRGIGTLANAPEREIKGGKATPQTDIFSTGILVLESISGRPAKREGKIRSLEELMSEAGKGMSHEIASLQPIINKATHEDPEARFTAVTFRNAVNEAFDSSTSTRPVTMPGWRYNRLSTNDDTNTTKVIVDRTPMYSDPTNDGFTKTMGHTGFIAEIEDLRTEKNEAIGRNQILRQENATLADQLGDEQAAHEVAREEVGKLLELLKGSDDKNSRLFNENQTLTTALMFLREELAPLREANENKDGTIEWLNEDRARLNSVIENLVKHASYGGENNSLDDATKAQLEKTITALQSQISSKDAKIKEQTAAIGQQNKDNAKLTKEANAKDGLLKESQNTVKKLRRKLGRRRFGGLLLGLVAGAGGMYLADKLTENDEASPGDSIPEFQPDIEAIGQTVEELDEQLSDVGYKADIASALIAAGNQKAAMTIIERIEAGGDYGLAARGMRDLSRVDPEQAQEVLARLYNAEQDANGDDSDGLYVIRDSMAILAPHSPEFIKEIQQGTAETSSNWALLEAALNYGDQDLVNDTLLQFIDDGNYWKTARLAEAVVEYHPELIFQLADSLLSADDIFTNHEEVLAQAESEGKDSHVSTAFDAAVDLTQSLIAYDPETAKQLMMRIEELTRDSDYRGYASQLALRFAAYDPEATKELIDVYRQKYDLSKVPYSYNALLLSVTSEPQKLAEPFTVWNPYTLDPSNEDLKQKAIESLSGIDEKEYTIYLISQALIYAHAE